ncbi:MAG: cytochrome c biogenesis protein CcsA [Pirellulaceae bacterium]
MDWLTRVTISCFGLSYAIAWGLEVARLLFRAPVKLGISVAVLVAGLLAHTLFLFFQARIDLSQGTGLASWHAWCLIVAWLLALATVFLIVRSPKLAYSPFLLPIVLLLIGVAGRVRDLAPFSRQGALSLWGTMHGLALLLGTVGVSIGFLAGVMYLVHAYQLKKKRGPGRSIPLPSLELLQSLGERSLLVSTALLIVGLVSGIVLNLLRSTGPRPAIEWSDPVIWTSSVLSVWLLGTVIFQGFYKPARHGRKVAYLVVASFLFLVLELLLVVSVNHGSAETGTPTDGSSPAIASPTPDGPSATADPPEPVEGSE